MAAVPANPFAASAPGAAALAQTLEILHTHLPAFDRPAGPNLTPSQALARQLVPQAFAKLQALADSPLPSIALRACQAILHFAAPNRIPLRRRHPAAPSQKRGPAVQSTPSSCPLPAEAESPPAPTTPPASPAAPSRSETSDQTPEIPSPSLPRLRLTAILILLIPGLLLVLYLALPWALRPSPPASVTLPPQTPPPAAPRKGRPPWPWSDSALEPAGSKLPAPKSAAKLTESKPQTPDPIPQTPPRKPCPPRPPTSHAQAGSSPPPRATAGG